VHGVVGYSPGVYDLFHVGHLDALTRAMRGCDRLVVGVLTDELAEELCGARPIVPLIERMEIVGSVRRVADVVEVTALDLRADWAVLGFDVVFPAMVMPGDDAERELAGTGVRVVAFDDLAETRSPVLRSALSGVTRRSSVA
jgi:glycerol-3-phosphate cytidylyltransferase